VLHTSRRVYRKIQTTLEKACWKDDSTHDPQKDFKVSTERDKKIRKTFEVLEGFCHIMLITSLKTPNTGMDDDDFSMTSITLYNINCTLSLPLNVLQSS
jgi:hypothetical protein